MRSIPASSASRPTPSVTRTASCRCMPRRCCCSRVPADVQGGRFAEDEAAGWGRVRRESQAGQPEYGVHRGLRLQPGQVHAETDVRPAGEGEVAAGVGTAYVEVVGRLEDRGITTGA